MTANPNAIAIFNLDALAEVKEMIAKPTKPKRKRKKPDYGALVLPRTGRLTRAFWLLKEGFTQNVRPDFNSKSREYDWRSRRHIEALKERGWLKPVHGPRGGEYNYRTTPDGAFAMLIAEGVHGAKNNPPE